MKDAIDRTGRGAAPTLAALAAIMGMAAMPATAPLAGPGAELAAQVRGQERAQERRQDRGREGCRCVDRDGNEIENCRCLRAWGQGDVLAFGTGPFFERRAQIGVYIAEAQDAEADRQGALITNVREGSPAEEAGIREGDVVVSVDGRSVFDALEDADAEDALDLDRSLPVQRFMRLVARLDPGEEVELEILRDGRRRTVTVTPERARGMVTTWTGPRTGLPEIRFFTDTMRWRGFEPRGEAHFRSFGDSAAAGERFGRLWAADPCLRMSGSGGERVLFLGGGNCIDGVELIDLNPELGEYFGTEEGVLVAEVADASTLGLRPGDVLIAVDGREVEDAAHARRILASYRDDEEVRLRIRRRGDDMEVLGTRR